MQGLSFYELGILETFGGQTDVSQDEILSGSPDEANEILDVLRGMFSKKLVSYDKTQKTFNFASLTYQLETK